MFSTSYETFSIWNYFSVGKFCKRYNSWLGIFIHRCYDVYRVAACMLYVFVHCDFLMCIWCRRESYMYIPFRISRLCTCYSDVVFFCFVDAFFAYDLYQSSVVIGIFVFVLLTLDNYLQLKIDCWSVLCQLNSWIASVEEVEERKQKSQNHRLLTRFPMALHPFPHSSFL